MVWHWPRTFKDPVPGTTHKQNEKDSIGANGLKKRSGDYMVTAEGGDCGTSGDLKEVPRAAYVR